MLWWTKGFPGTSDTISCSNGVKCKVLSDRSEGVNVSAYLFYGSGIDFEDLPRRTSGVIWALYHEESPRNVQELLHEPVLGLFNFSSTFSRYSDVPCTLQYLSSIENIISLEFYVETAEKNKKLNELAPILYLQSDCETSTERDKYVQELMKYIKIDSYGDCLNNKDLPNNFKEDYLNNLNDDEFLRFIARYKFVVAIENGVCNDYLTEKLWRPITVGSVPIYFGAPTVRDWLPNNKSAILIEDYDTIEKLKNHIKLLMENDRLYEEYLVHKLKGEVNNERLSEEFRLRPWSVDALETATKLECLVCERLHDTTDKEHIVNLDHYNCPKPVSALTLSVNPVNDWVYSWDVARVTAEELRRRVTQN